MHALSPAAFRAYRTVVVAVAVFALCASAFAQTPAPSAPAAPAESASRPSVPGILIGNNVHIRKGPGQEYPSFFQAPLGYRVELVGQQGSWLEIKFPGESFSWVAKEFLQKVDEQTGIMINANVHVRSGPGLQYDILYTVPAGHRFRILDTDTVSGAWFRVAPMPGETAWISDQFVRREESTPIPVSASTTPAPAPAVAIGSTDAVAVPAVQAPVYTEKYAQAEQLFQTETSKQNPADWDLDTLKSMYSDVAATSPNPLHKMQARRRLLILEGYQEAKDKSLEQARLDDDLKKQLGELEQRRQQEILAAASALNENEPYLATGVLEQFHITGLGATHKLVNNDSISFLLRSDVVDLKALEGRRVGVKGRVLPGTGQNIRTIEITAASILGR